MQGKVCIIIPAIKKNAVIPDQLVKKLNGITLFQRALNNAKGVVPAKDVYTVTDSHELSLICKRNQVAFFLNPEIRIHSQNILKELEGFIELKSKQYDTIIIYRANTPLVNSDDLNKALSKFITDKPDLLFSLKEENHRIWKEREGDLYDIILDDEKEKVFLESKSFVIVRSSYLHKKDKKPPLISSYLLSNEKAIEILSYQDWWICEKLICRKRILFVVAGYAAIGMGHVYRALTLAHEINDHEILFLCTRESELAVTNIVVRDYPTFLQKGKLIEDVLELKPDLVINDFLNTDKTYVNRLKAKQIKVVNFEDLGTGSEQTDITFNELYDKNQFELKGTNIQWGPSFFFLRDEFSHSVKRPPLKQIKNVLITFGGTDPNNYTLKVLQSVEKACKLKNLNITVVVGPGNLHKEKIQHFILQSSRRKHIQFISGTNVMSAIMENTDIAICSAGRTVYELAHMKIPALVLAQHERESFHTFARIKNGFIYIGVQNPFNSIKIERAFYKLLNAKNSLLLQNKMRHFDFYKNKFKVVNMILSLLN